MNLTLDTGNRKVSGDAQSLSRDAVGLLKLGRTESVSINLLNNGSSFTLSSGDSLILSLKAIGQYEGSLLQEVTLTSADLSDGRYTKTFSTYTSPILEILSVDSASGNDLSFALVMGVLAYKPSGSDRQESFEFYIRIYNAVVQDDDLPPDEVDGPEEWLTARAVRFDVVQTLTTGEKLQARTNIGASVETEINAATSKTTPVDADTFPLTDSAASFILKKVTWANIKATLKTYFDTVYVALTGTQTIAGVKTFSSDPIVPDEAYDATAWNGSMEPPTKNAVRDKIESMGAGGSTNIYVVASAMIPRVTNGAGVNSSETATNDVNYDTLDFDATTSEGAQFWVTMPNNWNAGTVTFKPQWTADSGSGTATFTLAGRALANDDAIDSAFGTSQSSTDTLIATGDLHIGPASSAITIGGTPANGIPIVFQVTRDVSDTLNADARLIGIEITFN